MYIASQTKAKVKRNDEIHVNFFQARGFLVPPPPWHLRVQNIRKPDSRSDLSRRSRAVWRFHASFRGLTVGAGGGGQTSDFRPGAGTCMISVGNEK
jgi:hypothetical protein